MAMQKKLVRHGNSLAVVIDRSVLRLLGMDEKTTLSVRTDGNSLVLTPNERDDVAFKRAKAKVLREEAKDLRALVD